MELRNCFSRKLDFIFLQHNQTVLQETICSGIVGGRLDFPRYASFASVKICLWLEDEYFAAYSRHSGLLDLSGLMKIFIITEKFFISFLRN